MAETPTLTSESRDLGRQLGIESRRANSARLRSKFLGEPEWKALASEAGIDLPPYGVPVTTAAMERLLRELGLTVEEYISWEKGDGVATPTLKELADQYDSQNWPLKAWLGTVLESLDRLGRITLPESIHPENPAQVAVTCRRCKRHLCCVIPGAWVGPSGHRRWVSTQVYCPKCGIWMTARRQAPSPEVPA